LTFSADKKDIRLDVYLAEVTGYTRSYIKILSDEGNITVNGAKVKCGKILKGNETIEINAPQKELDIVAQDIPISILYQDEDMAVIDKPQGLTVHPAGRFTRDTLVNALLYNLNDLSSINGVFRPGIVHRLDKDTSGVMVVAKSNFAHLNLSKQIEKRQVDKIYMALAEGVIKDDKGVINQRIGRSKKNRKLMDITFDGREAITEYEVVKRYKNHTLVQCKILTGRTHQIRVHLKFLGHPVVGDKSYGFKKQKFELDGQLLHSHKLTLTHPTTKEKMTFISPLPKHFLDVLNKLENL